MLLQLGKLPLDAQLFPHQTSTWQAFFLPLVCKKDRLFVHVSSSAWKTPKL